MNFWRRPKYEFIFHTEIIFTGGWSHSARNVLKDLLFYIVDTVATDALARGCVRSQVISSPWWRHQMENFSALLAICAGNSPVCGEFPTQRPVTRSFDVFFDLRLNKRLSKQSWGWWFETLSHPLWRQSNARYWPCSLGLFRPQI